MSGDRASSPDDSCGVDGGGGNGTQPATATTVLTLVAGLAVGLLAGQLLMRAAHAAAFV
jgi:hypothetical protein